MAIKARQSSADHPRAEVGEIDTRAPFQSVKAAVSLFGEGSSVDKAIVKKPKPLAAERVLAKEAQLQLAEKELNKLKQQLKNAETTKAQALVELERAKRTVADLTVMLKTIKDSKESAVEVMETAKQQAKQLETAITGGPAKNGGWKHELDTAREQYASAMTELYTAKQELRKIREGFEASLEAKLAASQQAAEADHASEVNKEQAAKISNDIASMQEAIVRMKLASEQVQLEHAKIQSETEAQRRSSRLLLAETGKKLEPLRKDFDAEMAGILDRQLADTAAEIVMLQKEIENAKASDINVVKSVTNELDDARETLQKIAEEEDSLRNLVESLKQELDSVKKEHSELKEKETEAESMAGNLHVKLRKAKDELEAALAVESSTGGASNHLILTLKQITEESENARKEAEMMKRNADELQKEANKAQIALEEAEKNLQGVLKDAEEAKVAEAVALDQIKILSENAKSGFASMPESSAQITISIEEHKALTQKVEESNKLAEMKVAAVIAQVEAVKASENGALNRLEATQKNIEELKTSTEEALNRAEMAEAAKKAVEGELRRWREHEQKKAAEAASLILAETEVSSEASLPRERSMMPEPEEERTDGKHKVENAQVMKKTLFPSLSGIFTRKKNLVEDG